MEDAASPKKFRYTGMEMLTGIHVRDIPCAFAPRPPVLSGEKCFVCEKDCFSCPDITLVSSCGIFCDCEHYFHRKCIGTEKTRDGYLLRCPECHKVVGKKDECGGETPLLTPEARAILYGNDSVAEKNYNPFPYTYVDWVIVIAACIYIVAGMPAAIFVLKFVLKHPFGNPPGFASVVFIIWMACVALVMHAGAGYHKNRGELKFA